MSEFDLWYEGRHTPEPWVEHNGSVYMRPSILGRGARIADMIRDNSPVFRPTTQDANARRIVLCVNACRGLTGKELLEMADATHTKPEAELECPTCGALNDGTCTQHEE